VGGPVGGWVPIFGLRSLWHQGRVRGQVALAHCIDEHGEEHVLPELSRYLLVAQLCDSEAGQRLIARVRVA